MTACPWAFKPELVTVIVFPSGEIAACVTLRRAATRCGVSVPASWAAASGRAGTSGRECGLAAGRDSGNATAATRDRAVAPGPEHVTKLTQRTQQMARQRLRIPSRMTIPSHSRKCGGFSGFFANRAGSECVGCWAATPPEHDCDRAVTVNGSRALVPGHSGMVRVTARAGRVKRVKVLVAG